MGTNFYAHTNVCKCCNRPEEKIHIGKSSCGWTFSFHATDEIRSYKQWLEILSQPNCIIVDEYDRKCGSDDFKDMIEAKRDESNNHAIACKDSEYDHSFLDDDGNSFSEGEFS